MRKYRRLSWAFGILLSTAILVNGSGLAYALDSETEVIPKLQMGSTFEASESDTAANAASPAETEAPEPASPMDELVDKLDLSGEKEAYLLTFESSASLDDISKLSQAILEKGWVADNRVFDGLSELRRHVSETSVFSEAAERVAVLQARAVLAQEDARRFLAELTAAKPSAGILYESYWISNTLSLRAPRAVVDYVAGLPGVVERTPNRDLIAEPVEAPKKSRRARRSLSDDNNPREIEANLAAIRVPKVWDELNITGKGVVIGIVDQGIDLEHPALLEHFRGWDSESQTLKLDGNYVDFVHPDSTDIDEDMHGTHVAGIAVGSENRVQADGHARAYNRIGVAPGAQFIAARAFKEGVGGTNENIIKACEWMLAPGGDPDGAPRIVNQSWSDGSNKQDLWFVNTAKAMREANILNVMSAGNNGSEKAGEGSIDNPASYADVFAVGASDLEGRLASFSRRGPSPYADAGVKPDVVAPGVLIRSSIPGNRYTAYNGTSMAAPHVTGLAALMLEANPNLTVSELENLIRQTAIPRTDADYAESPNFGYGYGVIDAVTAVNAALHAAGKTGIPASDYRKVSGQVYVAGKAGAGDGHLNGLKARIPAVGYEQRELRATLTIDYAADSIDPSSIVKAEWVIQPTGAAPASGEKRAVFQRDSYNPRRFSAVFAKDALPAASYQSHLVIESRSGNVFETEEKELEVCASVRPGAYRNSLDNTAEGFSVSGNFSVGTANLSVDPKPVSGTNMIGLNLGSAYIGTAAQSTLEFPRVDLTGLSPTDKPELVFMEYASWTQAVLGFQASVPGEAAAQLFNYKTEEKTGWHERRIDLSPFKGKVIDPFAFHIVETVSDGYGLYIDDVAYTLNGENVQASGEARADHSITDFKATKMANIESKLPIAASVEVEGTDLRGRADPSTGAFSLNKVPFTEGSLLLGADGYISQRIPLEAGAKDVSLGEIILLPDLEAEPEDHDKNLIHAEPGSGMKMLGFDNNNPLGGSAVMQRPQSGLAIEVEAPADGVLDHVCVYFAGQNPYLKDGPVSLELKQINETGRLIDLVQPRIVEGHGGRWNRYDFAEKKIKLAGKAYVIVRQILPKGDGPAVAIDASVRPGTRDYAKGKFFNGSFESLFGQGIFGLPMIRAYVATDEAIQDSDPSEALFDPAISTEPRPDLLLAEGQKPNDLVVIGDYEISPSRGMITKYMKKDDFVRRDPLESRVLEIPSTIGGVPIRSIGENAFGYSWGNYEVQRIVLPDGIQEVNAAAFSMLGAHEIILPDSLEKIYPRAFKQQKIQEIRLPEGLRHIGMSAFENNYDLKSLEIPDSVETIEPSAFQVSAYGKDPSLENLKLPNNPRYTTVAANAFANQKKLTELHIPEQIETINVGAFKKLGITQLSIPRNVRILEYSAFEACENLTSLELPDGLREIGSSAFESCALTKLDLPASLEVIDRSAFEGNSLNVVSIPEKVRFINYRAFAGNPLERVRLNTTLKARTADQGTRKIGYTSDPHPFGNFTGKLEIYHEDQVSDEVRQDITGQTAPGQIVILDAEAGKALALTALDGKFRMKLIRGDLPQDVRLIVEEKTLDTADQAAIRDLAQGRAVLRSEGYLFYLATADGRRLDARIDFEVELDEALVRDAMKTVQAYRAMTPGVYELLYKADGDTWTRSAQADTKGVMRFCASRMGMVAVMKAVNQAAPAPADGAYYGVETEHGIAAPKFNLTTSVEGGHGSISESKMNLPDGTRVEVRLRPEEGYELETVTVNGNLLEVQDLRFEIIMNRHYDVRAKYKAKPLNPNKPEPTPAEPTPVPTPGNKPTPGMGEKGQPTPEPPVPSPAVPQTAASVPGTGEDSAGLFWAIVCAGLLLVLGGLFIYRRKRD